MAMENRKPIADLTTEELKQLDADVMANVDLVGSCLFVASLFDEDILPPQGKRDKLRSKLHQDALLLKPFEPKKELDAIVEFAQNFFSKPPAQHTRSHLDKLRESLGKVRKWMDESAEEVIPEGTTYQQLNVILQAILTSKLMDNLIYSTPKNPGQSSGAIWRGGTLEEFILTGDPIVEHLSRNNKDTETRLTTKGRWILRKIITKLRDAHEASTVYGELTLKNVQITNDHHILLPRLHHGNQESIRQDLKAFKELIESMTGDLPKDVRHLCKMLGSANPGSNLTRRHPFRLSAISSSCFLSSCQNLQSKCMFRSNLKNMAGYNSSSALQPIWL